MTLTEKLAILVKDATLGDTLSFARGNTEILFAYSADDFTPNMTNYSAPSPNVVSDSGYYGGYFYSWKSFDGSTSGYPGVVVLNNGYYWWTFDLGAGNEKICAAYKLTYTIDYVGDNGCAPKDWKLQGSNDGSTWDDLDTVANETNWGVLESRTFQCDAATTAYRYFRLYVSAINGGPYGAELAEIELYLPTSDTATLLETDSGDNSTVWDMSTIANRENLGSQIGTLKYQYSCHNTTGNPTWNGTWLTLAQLQAISNPTGRYFQLKIQFADGIASFQDSYIEALIQGGAVDFPAESDVRDGVTFDNGNKEGTLDLPAVANVRKNITYDGATKTGLLDLPSVADVRDAITFDNNTKEGSLDLPSVNDVEKGVKFDGLSKTGTFKVPAIADVLEGVQYGANDTEFTGTLPAAADYPAVTDVLEDVVFDSGNQTGTLKKYGVTTNPADTLRQRIVDTVDARLQTITIANGYKTNLGSNIFEWRVTPLDPDTELPGAVHRDTQDTIDLTIGLHLHTLEIEINVGAKGSTTPADMRKLIGDIHEMIGTDVTWGSLAEDTKIKSEKIIAAHEENKFIGIEITIEVEFTTNVFNPFS